MSDQEMKRLYCKTCGVEFGVLRVLYDSFSENGGYYHCSNGHPWGWSKDRASRAQEDREHLKLKQRVAQLDDEVREKAAQVEAAKAETARLQKRVSKGVCPCCTRSFTNLARHMATKHPAAAAPDGD